jgi:hypothetical protein
LLAQVTTATLSSSWRSIGPSLEILATPGVKQHLTALAPRARVDE